jgi:hypothetical protein
MTGILTFQTPHGAVSVEVADGVALAAGGRPGGDQLVAKGAASALGGEILANAPKTFDQAMTTLRAYAANLEDFILSLDLTPQEVSVQIGLKLTGSAGFVIAKAGGESEMRVSLKWAPNARTRSPDAKPSRASP